MLVQWQLSILTFLGCASTLDRVLALSFDDFFVATAVVATAVVSVVAGLAATVPVIVAAADVAFFVMFVCVCVNLSSG